MFIDPSLGESVMCWQCFMQGTLADQRELQLQNAPMAEWIHSSMYPAITCSEPRPGRPPGRM